jgi:excisionase family DNA binding protein
MADPFGYRGLASAADNDLPVPFEQPREHRSAHLPAPAEEECLPCHAGRRYHPDISISKDTSALFVRLPRAAAEKLDRASFELKTPKRELVTELVERHLGGDVVVGRAVPSRQPDVLTAEQLADLLQVDVKTVRALAARGELPGRRIGRHWRFSREAVLEWLATPARKGGHAGFSS